MAKQTIKTSLFLPLLMGLFLLISPMTTGIASAHTQTSLKASAVPQPHKVLPKAGPSSGCTVLTVGNLYVDPGTGEVWKCQCTNVVKPQGEEVVCQWRLILARPKQSTWNNLNSGLYMDVEKVSTANGARVHQWTYTGANNQYWDMNNPTDAYMTATSVNSGKCLGVGGGSTSQGAPIVQWDCNGHPDQLWSWTWTGNYTSDGWPIWNIINANSGQCLGIGAASTQVGAYAVQWPCNGSPDQEWW